MENKLSSIEAVILCGGLGTRFQAVKKDTQKVMALFNDRPFLDIILEALKEQGIVKVVLCVGHKADIVEEYYSQYDQGLQIVFSKETEPLGTGGAIKNAQGLIKNDPFFVLNGDSFCPVDLVAFFEYFLKKKAINPRTSCELSAI